MRRRPSTPLRPRFHRTAQIAEIATAGVGRYLSEGELEIAIPLQEVAVAAWEAATDSGALAALHARVCASLSDLDQVTGAGRAREFLLDVDQHLEAVLDEQATADATGAEADPMFSPADS
jgi:hypothetical protein